MEDDKHQATPLLSICVSPQRSVWPPKIVPVLGLLKHSSTSVPSFTI